MYVKLPWPLITLYLLQTGIGIFRSVEATDVIHYSDVIMSAMASQITGVSMVCSTVCLGADQRKHQTPRHWPLWGEFTGDQVTGEFPSQWASNVEHVSVWWRHHHHIIAANLKTKVFQIIYINLKIRQRWQNFTGHFYSDFLYSDGLNINSYDLQHYCITWRKPYLNKYRNGFLSWYQNLISLYLFNTV